MKKQRVRISIALLLASTLVFLGITYYLISNTYKLEKNIFHFNSTRLVSEIFFSTNIDFEAFDNHHKDYEALVAMKSQNNVDVERFNELRLEVRKAFIGIIDIEQKIKAALNNEGIDTEIKSAYSISKIKNQANSAHNKTLLETNLRKNELILFGDDPDLSKYNFYTFHHSDQNTYYQSKLYINYPKSWTYILMQMKELLLGIILVTVVIFGVFIYTIQTIRRQKKLADIKNDFINNMAHELNTPISTISVSGQNLMKANVNEAPDLVKELAATIIRQNKRLQETVSQVMGASLIDSGNIENQSEKISLHNLLNEIIADFKNANPQKDLEISTVYAAKNDVLTLHKFHFTSAICNLLDNAIKYSGDQLKINISTQNKGEGIVIQISDNGIGISSADQKMVFEKFYRVAQGNIHKVKGLGLGLFLVKQTIELHRGQIELKSNLGEGCTFIINLPY